MVCFNGRAVGVVRIIFSGYVCGRGKQKRREQDIDNVGVENEVMRGISFPTVYGVWGASLPMTV